MKLILREDVYNLGKGGELVEVKPGYGRNYLLPRGLAVLANPKNVRELEHQKKVAEAKAAKVDYKDQNQMKYFLTERGKIIPRRISGNCARHQREVATAIKRARMLAILPYTVATA